mmetsp:Transcript_10143/g.10227  ORF Transcript_10143/g.10227 Transcript_10143/m.10227 type:complete len:851 (-) Transcript_10143:167-2719(-)
MNFDINNFLTWCQILNILQNSSDIWDARSVSSALFVLHKLSCEEDEPGTELLRVIELKLRYSLDHIPFFNHQAVAMSLYGLQHCSDSSLDVQSVLSHLSRLILKVDGEGRYRHRQRKMTGQEISNALYGLQHMSDQCTSVRLVLAALSQRLAGSSGPMLFSAQHTGMALYGLRGMTGSVELTALLTALLPHLQTSSLDHQAIATALLGLQGMSSDSVQVRNVVETLALCVERCPDRLTGREVSSALFGLQNMRCTSFEVRHLLRALTDKILNLHGVITTTSLSIALFGLQRMTSDTREVRDVLDALHFHVVSTRTEAEEEELTSQTVKETESGCMSSRAVTMSLTGFTCMSDHWSAVRSMLGVLADRIGGDSGGEVLEAEQVAQCMYAMRGMRGESKDLGLLLTAIAARIGGIKGKRKYSTEEDREVGDDEYRIYDASSSSSWQSSVCGLASELGYDGEKVTVSSLPAELLCKALSGMRHMDSAKPHVRAILSALLDRAEENSIPSAWAVTSGLYGVRRMSPDCPLVEDVLSLLSRYLHRRVALIPVEPLMTARETDIGALPSSLNFPQESFSSSSTAKREIAVNQEQEGWTSSDLERFVGHPLEDSSNDLSRFTGQGLAMAAYGLQNCSPRSPAAMSIILSLHLILQSQHLKLDTRCVSMALFGLRGFSCSSSSVRLLLTSLYGQLLELQKSQQIMGDQAVSMSLIGLQGMDASLPEVRGALRAIFHLLPPVGAMSSESVATAVYSLRKHSTELKEVKRLLARFSEDIAFITDDMTARQADLIACGIRDRSRLHAEVQKIFNSFMVYLESRKERHFREHLNELGAQTWMPLLVGFFLLKEQLPPITAFI